MNIEPTTLLTTARGLALLARLHIIWLLTQLGLVPTNNCGFFKVAVRLSSPSAICVHVLQWESHLSLDPLRFPLCSHPLPLSALTGHFQFSSTKVPNSNSNPLVPSTVVPLLYSAHYHLPFPISPCLKCGEMWIWLCTHKALPGPPTYLATSFSTAQTGNLLLACSVVLNCVTGAKWVPVLNSGKNAAQKVQVKKVRYQHD